ncbi:S8 family serine peptidase [Niallia sp. BSM11]|uniref:S8 family serine peptidase n=1 Tax=Niallia sp. BSM11 TaxID=3391576 RepID=UPI00398563BC
MKKLILLLSLIILPCSNHIIAAALELPDLPIESKQEKKVAIVKLKGGCSQAKVNELMTKLKSGEKRTVFCEIFSGFSVRATVDDLHKLADNHDVELVSQVKTYTAESERPAEIIGADWIRGALKESSALTGKGIKVGVIDTGIDYNHPDLKKSFKRGWDFVDRDKDPMETVGNGLRNTLHGTHVAGIIAAKGKHQGVAPNAEIYAYRALGPGGAGTTEQILSAIEKAVKDKVDVLNLSLGSEVNGPDLPISIALNKAVEKGIVAVAAAGNAGPSDWTVGSPGTAAKAISVGATTPNMKIPYIEVDGARIILNKMDKSKQWSFTNSLEIAQGGLGRKKELNNVKGKVVLLKRGELTFGEKAENAYKAGAKAVLIMNDMDGPLLGSLEKDIPIPVAGVTKQEGSILLEKLGKNKLYAKINSYWEKDILAEFSSRGPVTSTWDIKPDVVAPGVVINSTVPGGYLALQGTSMAAPHVAGAAALLLEAHPDWSPEDVKVALMNTALPLRNRNGELYKVYEQGAGRIQVDKAVRAEVLVLPGSMRFGKFKLADHLHEHTSYLTIVNKGSEPQWVTFKQPAKQRGITWQLPLSFTLAPGSTKKVPIRMMIDNKLFKNKLQNGALEVNAGRNSITIPYLYVLEEPEYPRLMGFNMVEENNGSFSYEAYLPTGAEEFGIAAFDKESLKFVKFLDWKKEVKRGQLKGNIKKDSLPDSGIYEIIAFAKKAGKEDAVSGQLTVVGNKVNYSEKR